MLKAALAHWITSLAQEEEEGAEVTRLKSLNLKLRSQILTPHLLLLQNRCLLLRNLYQSRSTLGLFF